MNGIEKYNPYVNQEKPHLLPENVAAAPLLERVVDWAGKRLFTDYEKRVDNVAMAAYILEKSNTFSIVALQGTLLLDSWTKHHLAGIAWCRKIHNVLGAFANPSASVYLGLGLIQFLCEYVQLNRISLLLWKMGSKDSPEKKLKWLHREYFTLSPSDAKKITAYIERAFPKYERTIKASLFRRIAHKALEVKFAELKRRITPNLAITVKEVLGEFIRGLSPSADPQKRQCYELKAATLIKSISVQGKNKIIYHLIMITAIFLSIISAGGALLGVTATLFPIALGISVFGLVTLGMMVRYGLLTRASAGLYDALANITLQSTEVAQDAPQEPIIALQLRQSTAPSG